MFKQQAKRSLSPLVRNFRKIFLSAVICGGFLSGGSVSKVFAQTEDTLHQQKYGEDGYQVQARGTAPDPSKSFAENYAPPKDITTWGSRTDWLFRYTSEVAFVFFLLMAGSLTYFVIFNRERPGHKAYYTHGHSKANGYVTRALDLAVFFSLDIVLMVASFRDARDFIWKFPTGPDVVKIQVMPQQWVWNFRYAGVDGQFGTEDDVVTVNEMRVPRGKPILVQIKSRDVIHGFLIPNVRRQIDALPGEVTKFWFDANLNGDYEIVCYHLCGTAHYKMKAFLKVVDQADYDSWIKEQSEWAKAKFDPADTSMQWGWNWGLGDEMQTPVKTGSNETLPSPAQKISVGKPVKATANKTLPSPVRVSSRTSL